MNLFLSLLFFYWTYGYKITSPDPVFYTDKHEYLVSQDIVEGSRLLNKNGETIEVCNVAKKDTVTEVYDLITQDGGYSAGVSGVMSGTCILRFLAENKTVYPNLYNNYKALEKSKRAQLVQDLYEARKIGNEIGFATALNKTKGVLGWQKVAANIEIRRDPSIITSIAKILDDVNVPPSVKEEIGEIVDGLARGGLKCRTCPHPGTGYRFIDEIIDDFNYVAVNFSNINGFSKLITNLKAGSTTSKGAAYVVDVLHNKQSLFSQFGQLSTIEYKFVSTENFAVDLVFGTEPARVFLECKSWTSNLLNIASESFVNQFANTLSKITDINQMKYLFNDAAGHFKPSAQNIIDALWSEKAILESIPESQLQKFIPTYSQNNGLSMSEITSFVNLNYSSIFL